MLDLALVYMYVLYSRLRVVIDIVLGVFNMELICLGTFQ